MRIGIVIVVFNLDSRIFIMQIQAIKKYCKDENYTIEVVDNSNNELLSEGIRYQSQIFGVNYRRVHSNASDPSMSHSFACNFSYQKLKEDYDIFCFLDHDIIPVKQFSIMEMLGDKIIAGVLSGTTVKYYWPGCVVIDVNEVESELIRFDPNHAMKTDTGGALHKIIEKYGMERCGVFDEVGCENESFRNTPLYYFYLLICNKTFIHFLNSSNWNETKDNDVRLNSLINITENLMKENDLLVAKQ